MGTNRRQPAYPAFRDDGVGGGDPRGEPARNTRIKTLYARAPSGGKVKKLQPHAAPEKISDMLKPIRQYFGGIPPHLFAPQRG